MLIRIELKPGRAGADQRQSASSAEAGGGSKTYSLKPVASLRFGNVWNSFEFRPPS